MRDPGIDPTGAPAWLKTLGQEAHEDTLANLASRRITPLGKRTDRQTKGTRWRLAKKASSPAVSLAMNAMHTINQQAAA